MAQTAPEAVPPGSDRFYVQMQKEEFLLNLIPKERFLLYLVQNVSAEMDKRRGEGVRPEAMGLEELTTPVEQQVQAYKGELDQTVALMDEIERLEQVAKRKVDLATLEALETLKARVREIIDSSGEALVAQAQQDTVQAEPEAPEGVAPPQEASQTEPPSEGLMADIYEQWRYNRILQYKLKMTQYQFLRVRLLRTATPKQERRMFRRALKDALEIYSGGDMEAGRLILNDLIGTYGAGRALDDVQYYAAEAAYGLNRLDEARTGYEAIEREYPVSPYTAKGLVKRIYIQYIYGDYPGVARLYGKLLPLKANLEKDAMGTVSYLVGYAHFRSGNYSEALSALANVASGATYYYPSIYLSAACYSNMGKDDLAVPMYLRLANEQHTGKYNAVLAQIKNNALLKLGLIHYERGENSVAMAYFDRVSAESENYDLSLMARAWSAYKSGRPGEALKNVEAVLESSVLSSYVYEARVLAASSKELMGQSEAAIADLKTVVDAKQGTGTGGGDQGQQGQVRGQVGEFERFQQAMLDQRNRDQFAEIERIRRFFQLSPAREDDGGEGRQFDIERSTLESQVQGLDALEAEARQRGNQEALGRIRRLRSQMLETLDDHSARFAFNPEDPNEDPLIRRLGLSEYFKYMFRSLLTETVKEKGATHSLLASTRTQLAIARENDDFDAGLETEIRLEELEDYYARLNQYEVWLRENMPKETHVELDRWATFSGYGISAINFNRIKEIDQRLSHVSQVISTMDRVFNEKRRVLDLRIRGLLDDVAAIEKEMQRESDRRTREQQEQFFKTDYFDKRTQESVVGKIGQTKKAQKGGKRP